MKKYIGYLIDGIDLAFLITEVIILGFMAAGALIIVGVFGGIKLATMALKDRFAE